MEINKSHLETGKCSWVLENQVAKPLGGEFPTSFNGKEETFGIDHWHVLTSSDTRAFKMTELSHHIREDLLLFSTLGCNHISIPKKRTPRHLAEETSSLSRGREDGRSNQ